MRTVSITVIGKVQGVFFRLYASKAAEEFELTGYVLNMANGDVKVVASGEPAQVKKMIEWCKEGSPGSEVTKVDVENLPAKPFSGFTIRYR